MSFIIISIIYVNILLILVAVTLGPHPITEITAEKYYYNGIDFSSQGKYDEAIESFDEAIRLDPNDAKAWNSKGNALNSQGKYDEAIESFEEAIRLDPNDAVAWYNKGNALNSQGKYDEAIRAYDKVKKLDYSPALSSDAVKAIQQAEDLKELNREFDELSNKWLNLPPGIIIFNPSPEMTQGIKERIEVRIANTNKANISDNLTSGLKGKGKPTYEEIKVAPMMSVELRGENFDIVKFTESKQVIAGNYTQWEWDAIPLEPGNQTLVLSVCAVIGDAERAFPIMEKLIQVNVNYRYSIESFLKQEWKDILTVIAAIGAALAAAMRWLLKDEQKKKIKSKLRTWLKI